MPDWKALAEAHGFTPAEIESLAPKLQALESVLRRALDDMPLETEPATTFDPAPSEQE